MNRKLEEEKAVNAKKKKTEPNYLFLFEAFAHSTKTGATEK
jgi:hypothetical protein